MYRLLILLLLMAGCTKSDFTHKSEPDQKEKQKKEENSTGWYYFI